MLHEILLSLSGLQSPIWAQARVRPPGTEDQETPFNQYVSPPERAMLDTLARLHDLHVQIRTTTTRLSRHHRSMVCRAVESAILRKDAGYVAAYEIVPLSTIVAEFSPWTRRLEWLWSVVQHLDPNAAQSARKRPPSGASILDLLEDETHTGYSDIEEMAVALLTVAQKSWMRATSLWVLYGKLPAAGNEDFCIKPNPNPTSAMDEFTIDPALAPKLLRPGAIQALLSAGSALSQLRSQATSGAVALQGFNDPSMALLQNHLTVLGSLQYPLNPTLLGGALLAINQSISENALSQILPRALVMQLLQVILRFMLLGHGEFAVSLIRHADDRIRGRQQTQAAARPVRKIGRLDDLAVKEAELNGVLVKTMAEIASLQTEDDLEDDNFHLARKLLSLKAAPSGQNVRLIATLLPTPTLLHFAFPAQSPLHIFLSSSDAQLYAHINAYLLSIHRAELHLSALWRLSSHRRCHPSPLGPPRSTSQSGRASLEARRLKDARRIARTRGHWTCASKLLFLVNELQAYLQGEVIQSSWTHFREWLEGKDSRHLSSARSSRPTTASSAGEPSMSEVVDHDEQRVPTDPRALADAHRRYLHALNAALFLTNDGFIESLKELLEKVDHLVALFSRLQTVWQGLDLEDDEGVVDAFSNYAHDEVEVLAEMDRTRNAVEASLSKIVDEIRDMEKEKHTGSGMSTTIDESMSDMNLERTGTEFVPWQARTVVDRLVMKLDGLFGRQDEDRHELIDGYDDD
ncbi:putative gamma-tubulin complex component GCP4 [Cladophialophora carrionii]|uniref:Spindle pole body component n=1 Tax=Cladophialophora carrionii TaxID=86049 RepID=A0A1C1C8B6_9EURO|nr:putative gamma-tubulin complex component GCP4 [Cladophialophora carrionii]